MSFRKVLSLAVLLMLAAGGAVGVSAAKAPAGAKAVKASSVRTAGAYKCVGTVPGTTLAKPRLKKGMVYWVTFATQAKAARAAASKATGARQRALRAKAKRLESKRVAGTRACTRNPSPTPGGGVASRPRPAVDRTIRWRPPVRERVSCTTPPTAPSADALRFDLCTARGITLTSTGYVLSRSAGGVGVRSGGGSTNIGVVTTGGSVASALTSGAATAGSVVLGPTGKTYLIFSTPVNLDDTTLSGSCVLAEVNEANGVPTCVDDALDTVGSNLGFSAANPPVQFDAAGRVYYTGRTRSGASVLRRADGVSKRDLITGNVELRNFLAMPDGSVLVTGRTVSTGATWTRWVSDAGSLNNIFATNDVNFVALYPDGNAYLGAWAMPNMGVFRFLAESRSLDPNQWISTRTNGLDNPAYFPAEDLCQPRVDQFCGWGGSYATKQVVTQSGTVLALSGSGYSLGTVPMQYWPEVKYIGTAVRNATTMEAADSRVALAGTNAVGQNLLTLYDPATDREVVVLGGGNEVEIYNLSYSPSQRTLLFDGLRFSDNQYVVGEVSVPGGDVRFLSTTPGRLSTVAGF